MRKSFPNTSGKTTNRRFIRPDGTSDLSDKQHSVSLNEVCAQIQPYLVSAGSLLSCLQALIHMDDTNFGSSLGGKPVPLHEIHDHHMVFQLCTKRFDLKSPVDGCFRVAGGIPLLMSFCRNSRLLHDTRNPVTSASAPGKHNFLCLIQVSSAAGCTWEVPGLDLSGSFPAPDLVVLKPQLQRI